jgi:hypothetical protein
LVNQTGFEYRLDLKKLSKTQLLIIIFACCLIIYAAGIFTNLFSSPIFSSFFFLSNEMARNIAYIAVAVAVALLTVAPALSLSPSNPKTEEAPPIPKGTSLTAEKEQRINQVNELNAMTAFLVGLIDLQFDILMDLYLSRTDWQQLKSRLQSFGDNYSFTAKTIPSLTIDMSNLKLAINNEKTKHTATDVYNTLTLIFGYLHALNTKENANLKESKDVLLAYLYLNYVWQKKADKNAVADAEKRILYTVLQRITSRRNLSFTNLEEIIEDPSQQDTEKALKTSRSLFLEKIIEIESLRAMQLQ